MRYIIHEYIPRKSLKSHRYHLTFWKCNFGADIYLKKTDDLRAEYKELRIIIVRSAK